MKTKNMMIVFLMILLMVTMSGCVHSNNKGWDDLSVQEQEEVKQALEDVREEISDAF